MTCATLLNEGLVAWILIAKRWDVRAAGPKFSEMLQK